MRSLFAAVVLICCLATGTGSAIAAGVPHRGADAIVLTGARVSSLEGIKPNKLVAFRRSGNRWKQVPVQVDQRAVVDYAAVRDGHQTAGRPFSHLAYTDGGTLAGSDPDPTLDANDEIAMMANDSGSSAPSSSKPSGVVGSSRVRVRVADPLQKKVTRYLYLFRSKGKLKPSAGKHYVDYDFKLDSGDYLTTYSFPGIADDGNGMPANPEDSTVKTPYYSQHLLSRWIVDQLRIKAGSSTAVDILDGDKAQVSFGCGRSELTFSRGGGGFIANKVGPVRAIRSYIGANSGTYTQRDDIYYQRAATSTTYLRVHPGITTISQFFDYSPAASGMKYRNSLNAAVTIDGQPDDVAEGPLRWEQVSGRQGSASIISRVDSDIPGFAESSYYLDDSTSPATQQCGGYADDEAWGSSGGVIMSSGSNTDPTLNATYGHTYALTGSRTEFFDKPNATASVAKLRAKQVDVPLTTSVHATK